LVIRGPDRLLQTHYGPFPEKTVYAVFWRTGAGNEAEFGERSSSPPADGRAGAKPTLAEGAASPVQSALFSKIPAAHPATLQNRPELSNKIDGPWRVIHQSINARTREVILNG